MKKQTFILFFFAIFLIGCVQQSPQESKDTNIVTYINQDHNIKINYPLDWEKQEGTFGTTVMFISPLEDDSDQFRENLNIIVQDISSQPMTLSEYAEISIGEIKQFITEAEILSSTEKRDSYEIVYTGKQGEFSLKWMQTIIIQNNKVYVISYTAEPDKYDNFMELIQKMIDSFEVIASAPQ